MLEHEPTLRQTGLFQKRIADFLFLDDLFLLLPEFAPRGLIESEIVDPVFAQFGQFRQTGHGLFCLKVVMKAKGLYFCTWVWK